MGIWKRVVGMSRMNKIRTTEILFILSLLFHIEKYDFVGITKQIELPKKHSLLSFWCHNTGTILLDCPRSKWIIYISDVA